MKTNKFYIFQSKENIYIGKFGKRKEKAVCQRCHCQMICFDRSAFYIAQIDVCGMYTLNDVSHT